MISPRVLKIVLVLGIALVVWSYGSGPIIDIFQENFPADWWAFISQPLTLLISGLVLAFFAGWQLKKFSSPME